jgi:hypothetical protein
MLRKSGEPETTERKSQLDPILQENEDSQTKKESNLDQKILLHSKSRYAVLFFPKSNPRGITYQVHPLI